MKTPYLKMACVAALLGSVLSAQPASAKVCSEFDPYTIRVNQPEHDRFTFQFCHDSNHGEVCEAIGKGPYSRDQLKSYARWSRVKSVGAGLGDGAAIVGGAVAGWYLGKVFGPGAPKDDIDRILNPIGRVILQVGLGVAGTAGGIITDLEADVLDPAYYWKRAKILSNEDVLLSGDKCVSIAGIKSIHPIAESLKRMFSGANDVAHSAPSSASARAFTDRQDGGLPFDFGSPASFGLAAGAFAP